MSEPLVWILLHPAMTPGHLGAIPSFLSADDPDPAAKQIDKNYGHGGGWRPLPDWKLVGRTLKYPGDPPLRPLAQTVLREETILFYDHAVVAIIQPDGSFEAARVD